MKYCNTWKHNAAVIEVEFKITATVCNWMRDISIYPEVLKV
jgi:hypothetical protein